MCQVNQFPKGFSVYWLNFMDYWRCAVDRGPRAVEHGLISPSVRIGWDPPLECPRPGSTLRWCLWGSPPAL